MGMMVFDDVDAVCRALARKLVAMTDEDRQMTVALSGGSTPKRLFNLLSSEFSDVNWSNIHFFWGDERCVDFNSSESNYGEAKLLFLDPCGVPEENVHPIQAYENPENEANRYAGEIIEFTGLENGLPVFDLVILGLGADGHTASLFPERKDLWFTDDVCVVVKHPESGQERVTITGPVINNAKVVLFLCTGQGKADVVSQIIKNENCLLPATKVYPIDGELLWFMDRAATTKI